VVLQVIWRRASTSNPLTVGTESFTTSNRFMAEHLPETHHWNLVIKRVEIRDAGVYECQVSSKLRHLRTHVLLEVHGESRHCVIKLVIVKVIKLSRSLLLVVHFQEALLTTKTILSPLLQKISSVIELLHTAAIITQLLESAYTFVMNDI
jgi:hypothetical protein